MKLIDTKHVKLSVNKTTKKEKVEGLIGWSVVALIVFLIWKG